jgi:Family of unknown function (DUF6064)
LLPLGAVMSLPFTADQFLENLAQYNAAVWPMQLILNMVALACVGLLFKTQLWASRMISLLLTGVWLWMALAYHLAFFASINPIAWCFGVLFSLGGMVFDWLGVVNDRLRFHASGGGWQLTGAILLITALGIYPAVSYGMGHHYPAAPTFGLRCPTTIFTIGMLLFLDAPAPRNVFIVPILWSIVGTLGAVWLGMLEDLSLTAAGIIGLIAVLFLHGPTNLSLRSNAPHPARH